MVQFLFRRARKTLHSKFSLLTNSQLDPVIIRAKRAISHMLAERNSQIYIPVTKWTTFTDVSRNCPELESVQSPGVVPICGTTRPVGAEWYPDRANLPYVQTQRRKCTTRVLLMG